VGVGGGINYRSPGARLRCVYFCLSR